MTDRKAQEAADLVAETADVLEARPRDAAPPAVLVKRGWGAFLQSLTDAELDELERHGLDARWPSRTPADLSALLERARAVTALERLAVPSAHHPSSARRHTTPRKEAQVGAFASLVSARASAARRILDVGSGHGHLTRDLAERTGLPVMGLERDPRLVERARALAAKEGADASFAVVDVVKQGLDLEEGDFVIGLHACGELGDEMVRAVAHARGAALILVGCCPQKRRSEHRVPLSGIGPALPRALLGLANLSTGDDGVEASRHENLAARERRMAVAWLLERAGVDVRPQAELMGLNRRAAHRPLDEVAARVFSRLGLPAPDPALLEEAARVAAERASLVRRWALPRHTLARVLEVSVLLDRARHLEAHGLHVSVGELFPREASPRNLALVAVPA